MKDYKSQNYSMKRAFINQEKISEYANFLHENNF